SAASEKFSSFSTMPVYTSIVTFVSRAGKETAHKRLFSDGPNGFKTPVTGSIPRQKQEYARCEQKEGNATGIAPPSEKCA
ncbi:MAG: hypothetical protein IJB41_10675, partial [Clostridia bacterium]|nr:hypothetical protein [Clostridia bacterium]